MRLYLAAFLLASIAAAALTPAVRAGALRAGAVSRPGGRHVHAHAVPRLGGVALYCAIGISLGAMYLLVGDVKTLLREHTWHLVGIAGGASAMFLLGLADDLRRIRAFHKLIVQIVVAVFAFGCGFRIDAISTPFGGLLHMGVFALPVTILWIVGIVNAINLIDGLDGLAAGIVLFAAITNLIVARLTGDAFIGLLMVLMAGAIVGFLFFNFNPARIFMGDSGSYLLGYVLATTVLVGATQKASTAVSLLVPCLALGVPIFDTMFSILRRFLEKRPLFSPDRGHIHHRLIEVGLTHRRAVLILYAVSLAFSVAAIATCLGQSWQAGLAVLVASLCLAAVVRSTGYLHSLRERLLGRGRMRSPAFDSVRQTLPNALEAAMSVSSEKELVLALGRHLGTFARIELRQRGAGSVAFAWSETEHSPREMLVASYRLGGDTARAEIALYWPSDREDVAPDLDILLQLLADLVTHRLTTLGSTLAPLPLRRKTRTSVATDYAGRLAP